MRSTFMGLEIARRGMFTQQSALYTTGQNISNANTPGYSRQRVNFNSTNPYPSIGIDRVQIPGQMGTGVEGGTVQRIRESFLDLQYRVENNKVGYYGSLSESLTKMEEIMNEPSDSGLLATLDKFWSALETVANNTENSGARDVVASTGQMVADTLNYYYNSITRVQNDIGNEINVKVQNINAIVSQIDSLNKQIAEVEPHGYLPNDLYDQRDLLVDNLSKLVNIKVTNVKPINYGDVKEIAEGLYNIEIVQDNGSSFNPPINLVSVSRASGIIGTNKLELNDGDTDPNSINGPIQEVTVGGKKLSGFNFGGELAGLIKSYGYKDGTDIKGHYPEMINDLNVMSKAFADEFNAIHKQGYMLGQEAVTPPAVKTDPPDFFVFDPATSTNYAQAIKVNDVIKDDPSKFAAGLGNGNSGNNGNAQLLADLRTKSFSKYTDQPYITANNLTGSLDSFYSGIIGKLGVNSQSAAKDASNSQILADSVEENRQSVSAVSLDEEMTNLIKFQHAYNASARNITMIDEMLDKIINGMGTVGR
ncbi:flagellar hook-associated protein FlgK [Bacillus massilinigeriensis]|uniref:flagellar hook-associated protein FlgK n=1 Tax=Bacillus massilionigeriensis TaxID=1805475 RepID=UPI00096AF25D|nr:flagellar hook-associated protein FlgK [Bacillus massilionigeriensis]